MIEGWKSLVGGRSEPVENVVEAEAVRLFAEAIGDPSPLYAEEEAARRSPHGGPIAPPTFPYTLDYGRIRGMGWPESGMVHGEHRVSYERPLRVGETVLCHTTLAGYHEKPGRSGPLGFVVLERVGETPEGRRIFTMLDTAVVTPALREALGG